MQYTQIISLGGWCQATAQLQRLRVPGPHSVFDWIGVEFDSVLAILEHEAAGLAEEVQHVHEGTNSICTRYRTLLTHEFRRDVSGRIITTPDQVAACARRLQRRWRAFDAACRSGEPTLFVRLVPFGHAVSKSGYTMESRVMNAAEISRLTGALRTRYPQLPFDLALIYHPEIHPVDLQGAPAEIIPYPMPLPNLDNIPDSHKWLGSHVEWDRFAEIFSLPRRAATRMTDINLDWLAPNDGPAAQPVAEATLLPALPASLLPGCVALAA